MIIIIIIIITIKLISYRYQSHMCMDTNLKKEEKKE